MRKINVLLYNLIHASVYIWHILHTFYVDHPLCSKMKAYPRNKGTLESHMWNLIPPFKNIAISLFFTWFGEAFNCWVCFLNFGKQAKSVPVISFRMWHWPYNNCVWPTKCQLVCFQLVLCLGVVTSTKIPSQLPHSARKIAERSPGLLIIIQEPDEATAF